MSGTKTSTFGTSSREGHDSTLFYNSNLYKTFELIEVKDKEENALPAEVANTIICSSSEKMEALPNNSVHLMITSPPYNVSKDYDEDLSLQEYLSLLRTVFTETYRVLTDGGRACVNIANVGRKPYIPLSDYVSLLMREIGFNQRGEIIWDKDASAGSSCAWGSFSSASAPSLRDVHEYILVFSKGSMKREKGEKKDTIKKDDFIAHTKSIWRMPTASAKKIGHPAPFPEEMPHRLIQLYSFRDDVVLDPFMGSGQTAIAAKKSGRVYVGYDNNQEYVTLAEKRLSEVLLK